MIDLRATSRERSLATLGMTYLAALLILRCAQHDSASERTGQGTTKMRYDVVAVGAGAAGLMSAIFAGRQGARVAVVDSARRIGAKILISGGGRCNVTHDGVSADDFNGNRNTVARVLRTFTVDETIAFFEALGVALKREETGKLFPVTDRASTVLDALLRATRDAGVEIISGTRVNAIEAGAPFVLEAGGQTMEAARVVLATGGRSVPKTG